MLFRSGKNNRSYHNLVGIGDASTNASPTAIASGLASSSTWSNTALLSTSDSFQLDNGGDSSSVDDLPSTFHNHSDHQSSLSFTPHSEFIGSAFQDPPSKKSSTRKLVKNFFTANISSQASTPITFSSTRALSRRSSKRTSQPQNLRTDISQLSPEQQQLLEWQTKESPSRAGGLQNSHPGAKFRRPTVHEILISNPTIWPVHSKSADNSLNSAEEPASYPHQQHQQQLNCSASLAHQLFIGASQHQQQLAQFDFGTPQQQQQYHSRPGQQQAHQQVLGGAQQSHITGHLGQSPQPNFEAVSYVLHKSATQDLKISPPDLPLSQTFLAASYPFQARNLTSQRPSTQAATPQQLPPMAPPNPGPPPNRRSQEADKSMRDQLHLSPGTPPAYIRHAQQQSQQAAHPQVNMNSLASASSAGCQNPNLRQNNINLSDRPHFPEGQENGPGLIQGRASPQPPAANAEGPCDINKDPKDLRAKYKHVKRLYFDRMKENVELNGQVVQLQNAIANQRLSQSRTSLDDGEYVTRFNRLNGAITNISFNVRKDWKSLPGWIASYVSTDALKTGKQEMTAVGRAVITRFLVDQIFNSSFHPGLDPELSKQLKSIEHNIRNFSYTMSRPEEFDALTTKVVTWRMTTLEGLQNVLRTTESGKQLADFTAQATKNLTNALGQHLTNMDSARGGVGMIVDLAVEIAKNLPLESRDVAISYPLPEDIIEPTMMEVEKTVLPTIEMRLLEGGGDGIVEENGKDAKDRRGDKTRSGMLNTMLGSGGSNPGSRKGSLVDPGSRKDSLVDPGSVSLQAGQSHASPLTPKDPSRVRFAGFVAVEVRGRQVLAKAPVWTLA